MKEFLDSPADCNGLLESINTKLTAQDIYHLHSEELIELLKLNSKMYWDDPKDGAKNGLDEHNKRMDQKESYFQVDKMLKNRSNLEEKFKNMWNDYQHKEIKSYWLTDENQESLIPAIKDLYRRTLLGLFQFAPDLTEEEINIFQYKILDRHREISWSIEDGDIEYLINLLVKHLRADKNNITVSLLNLWDIHTEDFMHSISAKFWQKETDKFGWPWVVICMHIFELIDYTELKARLTTYQDGIKEHIMRNLERSLPTIQRMMNLNRKVQWIEPGNELTQIHTDSSELATNESIKIDTKWLIENEVKWDAINTLLKSNDTEVIRYLEMLKSIINPEHEMSISEALKNVLEAGEKK